MQDNGIITVPSRHRRRARTVVFLIAAGASSAVLLLTARDGASAATLTSSHHATAIVRTGQPVAQESGLRRTVTRLFGAGDTEPAPVVPPPSLPPVGDASVPSYTGVTVPNTLAFPRLALPVVPAVTGVAPVPIDVPPLARQAEYPEPSDPGARSLWLAASRARWRAVASAAWIAAHAGGSYVAAFSWRTPPGADAAVPPPGPDLLRAPDFATGEAHRVHTVRATVPVPRPAPEGPAPALPAAVVIPAHTGAGWSPDHGRSTPPPFPAVSAGGTSRRVIATTSFGNESGNGSLNGSRAPPPQEAH